jgi:hypothetical protein
MSSRDEHQDGCQLWVLAGCVVPGKWMSRVMLFFHIPLRHARFCGMPWRPIVLVGAAC